MLFYRYDVQSVRPKFLKFRPPSQAFKQHTLIEELSSNVNVHNALKLVQRPLVTILVFWYIECFVFCEAVSSHRPPRAPTVAGVVHAPSLALRHKLLPDAEVSLRGRTAVPKRYVASKLGATRREHNDLQNLEGGNHYEFTSA